jgi:transcriptional regulator with XRE-family HTH domain
MAVAISPPGVGPLLRDWRQRRRMSQLDLAVESQVSARHLSFVETGRSRPSRELVLHLAEHLEVPLRDRNSLLLAAGYAPVYPQKSLDGPEMDPVRKALDKILTGHQPFPAVVVDRHWNLVSANAPASAILSEGVAPDLLTPPINVLRVNLHPDGLAPRIVNLAEYSGHLLLRLRRQAAISADPELTALIDELLGYPGITEDPVGGHDPTALLFVPVVLRAGDGAELSFFSTLATFGTALDVTLAELCIEAFFPADETTAAALSVAQASRNGSTMPAGHRQASSSGNDD